MNTTRAATSGFIAEHAAQKCLCEVDLLKRERYEFLMRDDIEVTIQRGAFLGWMVSEKRTGFRFEAGTKELAIDALIERMAGIKKGGW